VKAAGDDDISLSGCPTLSLSSYHRVLVSALGWVFDEDELDPLPGCG
jgi:hypothetical protein